MSALYFAYGSNLKLSRMRARVASARVVGTGRLRDFRLALDKRGADGSGKANVARERGARVWGVVYAFEAVEWARLDGYEPGYERTSVEVLLPAGPLAAETYVARLLTGAPVAFDWYKELIVEGAREHGLPPEWIGALGELPARPDPRRAS